jgi:hypothetical protein
MGTTLTPDNLPAGRDRRVGTGHGTGALGPSDSSDTGSDLVGAHGLAHDLDRFGLDRGNNEDPDESRAAATGGPDVGDGNLDSDSDRFGTGERGAAGRDAPRDAADIGTDRIVEESELDDNEEDADRSSRKRS